MIRKITKIIYNQSYTEIADNFPRLKRNKSHLTDLIIIENTHY